METPNEVSPKTAGSGLPYVLLEIQPIISFPVIETPPVILHSTLTSPSELIDSHVL